MYQIRILNLKPRLVFLYGWNCSIRLEPRDFPHCVIEFEAEEDLLEPSILRAIANGIIKLDIRDINPVPPPVEDPEPEVVEDPVIDEEIPE